MKTIKPFIDLGWHTVPLKGDLKRLDNGKKTIPQFPKDWKNEYTKNLNTEDSNIGGVITGLPSNIIAIDCDNTTSFNLVKSLDPDYKCIFTSIGKKDNNGVIQQAGTYIYKYVPELKNSYKLHNNIISIEY